MATACENCGRDFANWWNWIRFWNRPVKRFSVGVYCFRCADPMVLLSDYWKKMENCLAELATELTKLRGA